MPDASRGTAIVLAGGKSTRLGRDKASELLMGRSLLQRALDSVARVTDECIVVSARGQQLPDIVTSRPLRIVEDLYPETGPLGGIYTGLSAIEAARASGALVVACDMPLLQPALLSQLLCLLPGHDIVAPLSGALPQPLCAAYGRGCIEPMRRRLDRGAYRLLDLLEDVDTLLLPPEEWRRFDAAGRSFLNVNHEPDLQRAEALIRAAPESP